MLQISAFVILASFSNLGIAAALQWQGRAFEHITFQGITPTSYTVKDDALQADVNTSSSFLLSSFKEVQQVDKVEVFWIKRGTLSIPSAKEEETKEGDDAYFKIGLLLKGPSPLIPFFAPAWIKIVRKFMVLPSDKMIYLVLQSRHEPGNKWRSPYSDSIEHIAMQTTQIEGSPQVLRSSYSFQKPQPAVGIWLMADGDNTRSRFEVMVQKLNGL